MAVGSGVARWRGMADAMRDAGPELSRPMLRPTWGQRRLVLSRYAVLGGAVVVAMTGLFLGRATVEDRTPVKIVVYPPPEPAVAPAVSSVMAAPVVAAMAAVGAPEAAASAAAVA